MCSDIAAAGQVQNFERQTPQKFVSETGAPVYEQCGLASWSVSTSFWWPMGHGFHREGITSARQHQQIGVRTRMHKKCLFDWFVGLSTCLRVLAGSNLIENGFRAAELW